MGRTTLTLVLVLIVVAVNGCRGSVGASSGQKVVPLKVVIDEHGVFAPRDGQCEAAMEVRRCCYPSLVIRRVADTWESELFEEVTGLAWLDRDSLAFTLGSIYGSNPGLFVFSCHSRQSQRLVAPQTAGTKTPFVDYFELAGVRADAEGESIRFYYSPTHDIDFAKFRSDRYLFEVRRDGRGFRKVVK